MKKNKIKKWNKDQTREILNKKIELNLNLSNSKNEFNKNNKEKLSSSFHSTKQIKPIHMKKDFYVPTFNVSLISHNNKNLYSDIKRIDNLKNYNKGKEKNEKKNKF